MYFLWKKYFEKKEKLNTEILDVSKEKKTEYELENQKDKTEYKTEYKPIHLKQNIKHIVLSGGAAGGLYIYGALKTAHQNGLWKYENIETLWGTSAGALICVIIALNIEWGVLDDYFIKRPWKSVFKLNWLDLWNEKGIMGPKTIKEIMSSLFQANEIPLNINLEDFCKLTGKELHLFTTELDMEECMFHLIDLNPITHPKWLVLDAIYASCCLPLIFKPHEMIDVCIGGEDASGNSRIYLDGGILSAFPFNYCIKYPGIIEEEVMGIYLNKWENVFPSIKKTKPLNEMNLFNFMKIFSSSVFNYTDKTGRQPPKSEKALLIKLVVDMYDRFDIKIVKTEEKRAEYIERGSEMFYHFCRTYDELMDVKKSVDESVDVIVDESVDESVEKNKDTSNLSNLVSLKYSDHMDNVHEFENKNDSKVSNVF